MITAELGIGLGTIIFIAVRERIQYQYQRERSEEDGTDSLLQEMRQGSGTGRDLPLLRKRANLPAEGK